MKLERPVKYWKYETKRIWSRMLEEWNFDFQGRLLLKTALEEYDKWLISSEKVRELGPVITTPTGQLRRNPACDLANDARSGFLAAWLMLHLDVAPPGEVGRPGKGII